MIGERMTRKRTDSKFRAVEGEVHGVLDGQK